MHYQIDAKTKTETVRDETVHRQPELVDAMEWSGASLEDAEQVVRKNLQQRQYSEVAVDFALPKKYSVMIWGAPRVGKSSLINAIVGSRVAKVGASLDSVTKEAKEHTIEVEFTQKDTGKKRNVTVSFWDSPGVEDWSPENFTNYVSSVANQSVPVCAIYCASPGSFAATDSIKRFTQTLHKQNVLDVLCITNMHSGDDDGFEGVLKQYKEIMTDSGLNVTALETENFWKATDAQGKTRGLITCVNSSPYIQKRLKVNIPEQNVQEMMMEIFLALDGEQLTGWCLAILENRGFWKRFEHGLVNTVNTATATVLKWINELKRIFH